MAPRQDTLDADRLLAKPTRGYSASYEVTHRPSSPADANVSRRSSYGSAPQEPGGRAQAVDPATGRDTVHDVICCLSDALGALFRARGHRDRHRCGEPS